MDENREPQNAEAIEERPSLGREGAAGKGDGAARADLRGYDHALLSELLDG